MTADRTLMRYRGTAEVADRPRDVRAAYDGRMLRTLSVNTFDVILYVTRRD